MQLFTHSPKTSCFACVCFLRTLPPSFQTSLGSFLGALSQIHPLIADVQKSEGHNEALIAESPRPEGVCSGFLMNRMFLCFQLDQWPRFISARFQYTVYPITFSVGNAEEWKKLFKPCAAQRLFLPVRLQLYTLHVRP